MTRTTDRRTFLMQATALGLAASTSRAGASAAERIACAVIGTGGRSGTLDRNI